MTAAKVQAMPSPIVPSEGVTVHYLSLTALHLAPWNARQSFDEQAQKELVGSIREHGILVALIVRPLEGASRGFEIVAGHRRFLAAGVVKLDELPCDVRSLTDEQAREVGLVDNLQRADLSAMEEAEAYQQMFQLAGDAGRKLTPADIAAKVGKPEGHVRLRLRLLSAEVGVREHLRAGQIELGHALELARFEPPLQKELLRWVLYEPYEGSKAKRQNLPSVAQLKRHIAEDVMLDLAKAPFDTKDSTLVSAAGACVDCPKRTGNNRLLFADVKQGDICTDPPCYASKVTRHIDVTIEQLTAKGGKKVVRISENWQRAASSPKDALTNQQYSVLDSYAQNAKQQCDDIALGVFIDGRHRGQTASICLNSKCKVHHPSYVSGGSSPDNAARRSKARLEKECRVRIFKAALEKSAAAKTSDAEIRALAVWAVDRADSNGSVALMNLLGWPKELVGFGGRAKLAAQMAKVPAGRAVAIALLASVAGDLSVGEYSSGRPDALHDVASRYGVQVGLIRKAVAAEFANKKTAAKKPAPAKKKPAIGKAARKKIAAAQKARLVKVRK